MEETTAWCTYVNQVKKVGIFLSIWYTNALPNSNIGLCHFINRYYHDRYDVCMYITYGISTVSCYIPSTGTQFSKVLDFSL